MEESLKAPPQDSIHAPIKLPTSAPLAEKAKHRKNFLRILERSTAGKNVTIATGIVKGNANNCMKTGPRTSVSNKSSSRTRAIASTKRITKPTMYGPIMNATRRCPSSLRDIGTSRRGDDADATAVAVFGSSGDSYGLSVVAIWIQSERLLPPQNTFRAFLNFRRVQTPRASYVRPELAKSMLRKSC